VSDYSLRWPVSARDLALGSMLGPAWAVEASELAVWESETPLAVAWEPETPLAVAWEPELGRGRV